MFHPSYEILKTIAHHDERETFLAKSRVTQTEVIIKVLHLSEISHWKSHEQFEREIQTLRYLKHPQIPKYIEHFEIQYQGKALFCVVMEKIRGESLAERIESGVRIHEQEAIALAKSILAPLAYLHSLSPAIIHRDLKPSNIMLDRNNTAYIIDFGAMQGTCRAKHTVAGTFGYMAPEQITGHASVRSDLYNLGVTLLSLLSHLPPEEMPREDLRFNIDKFLNVSPAFCSWLGTLVEPLEKDRFTSAQEALTQLGLDQKSVLKTETDTLSSITPEQGVIKKENDNNNILYTIPAAYQWGSIIGELFFFSCIFLTPFGAIYWILNHFLPVDYARWGNYILSPFFILTLMLWTWLAWGRLKSNLVTAYLCMGQDSLTLQHRWINLLSDKAKTLSYKQIKAIDFDHTYGLLFRHPNEEESELYFEANLSERRWLEVELKAIFQKQLLHKSWENLEKQIQSAKVDSFSIEKLEDNE